MDRNIMETVQIYEAPIVSVVDVQVEKGFALSGDNEGIGEGPGSW